MIELRPYQRDSLNAILDYWAKGGGNPLAELATGTGKSVIIATLTRELIEQYPDMRVLMLVHVRELVAQNAQALLRAWPQAPLGINSAGLGRRDLHSKILFASVQSVFRNPDLLGARDLVVVDEAHLVPRSGDGMYRTLLSNLRERVPDLRVAGFTATGYRLDSGRLDSGDGRLFDETVYAYGIGEGVRDGYLSPLRAPATGSEINVAGVGRRGGEFIPGELEKAADRFELIEAAATEIVERGKERRSGIVFCAGVNHAGHVRDAIKARGETCETVTGETPSGERDRLIRAFKAGQIRYLTNAMVLTTGFDAPQVDLIAMLRPTLSTGLYVQCLGRGTRLADGKKDCLVLDFAGNVRRHGPVDAINVEGGKEKRQAVAVAVKPDTVRAKICPSCKSYVSILTYECPYCGHEWQLPKPKHQAKADDAPIMATTAKGPSWIIVKDVTLHEHEKFEAPPSLRVEYLCGMSVYREWVTFEHKGFPRAKAEAWWQAMGGRLPVPFTVKQAIDRAGELGLASHVTIAKQDKYWRVTGHRVERRDGSFVEIDDRLRVRVLDRSEAA